MGFDAETADEQHPEADYWEQQGERAHCLLCPQDCTVAEGNAGICRVRRNIGGTLRSINYGRVTSVAMDPIEKKPLYHFRPGTQVLSLGTFGCNLSCGFCQNYTISQGSPATRSLSPEEAVRLAESEKGNIGIAYTYSEPIVWFEYVRDTAKLAKEKGLANVLVTNGLIREEPLEELLPLIDAMNVDIKAIDDRFHRSLCGISSGRQARETVERAWGRCTVEITNLLVTDRNDSEEDVRALVDWAAGVSPHLPLHISRYHPCYRLSEPPTPVQRIERAVNIAREQLSFVYGGNVSIENGSATFCPACGEVVIERSGYRTSILLTDQGACPACGSSANVTI